MTEHAAPPSPDLARAASDLRIAVFRLARRMRTERAVDSMSDGQFAVLAVLSVHGPHTLTELADRERVSAPSMNRTVNCLQEAGYITRSADESDGRKVVIDLSDDGRTVVDETARRRDAWVEEALAEISPEERAIVASAAAIMQRMVAR
ncbi:MarR family transcriptional regulator [Microbacterium sp. zg.B48]|uniref:MarR family winged helix-turn-helix transcriptional regulator n=1 Tax=unclassified Microbacterium TaxID=2609290 RepID=UPI00214ABDF0|nr:MULTISPECIES: MarR family transcriptional regulator [unclassified Microbacterium]MCR2763079.1 MarR family transcriptional regulator [Microbacterium sp. zg.B48]MCR2808606.1 MarR family transcriptional regulator [Microbacterium sp. zg.B185]WIM18960.1 MarR family transcriptional regulator [Microbacterium sp. zg-B185]